MGSSEIEDYITDYIADMAIRLMGLKIPWDVPVKNLERRGKKQQAKATLQIAGGEFCRRCIAAGFKWDDVNKALREYDNVIFDEEEISLIKKMWRMKEDT